ncbi:hypothetical protein SADUNF_Sadunf09G0063200 [Salix dunnii]|uniref:GTD-binding domain-containing protein n=1 Tax=Salix dunnii TaxID=1413687 RepID=A0A835JVH7_9ROSI|nr:hypothetical protein SADUNF_Sadunf09G0063200 [Salix dunnii]
MCEQTTSLPKKSIHLHAELEVKVENLSGKWVDHGRLRIGDEWEPFPEQEGNGFAVAETEGNGFGNNEGCAEQDDGQAELEELVKDQAELGENSENSENLILSRGRRRRQKPRWMREYEIGSDFGDADDVNLNDADDVADDVHLGRANDVAVDLHFGNLAFQVLDSVQGNFAGFFGAVFDGLRIIFEGLRFLQFTWHVKCLVQFLCGFRGESSAFKNRFCSKLDFDKLCDTKILSCLENSKAENEDNSMTRKEVANDSVLDDDDYEREYSVEDEEHDVTTLRRLVKIERLRAHMAYAELEKERMASASAADEAMAMILRLQNEKSSSEIEAKQYRQLAEQKQEIHLEMIESLQWDIIKLEHERSEMEESLRMHREKSRQYMKSDEEDQSEGFGARTSYLRSTMEDSIKDVLNLSLDNMDSSVL